LKTRWAEAVSTPPGIVRMENRRNFLSPYKKPSHSTIAYTPSEVLSPKRTSQAQPFPSLTHGESSNFLICTFYTAEDLVPEKKSHSRSYSPTFAPLCHYIDNDVSDKVPQGSRQKIAGGLQIS
ncbi:hypothetical protein KCU91_g157, partial [Aureobasidium melanogenum]